ncbi:hypothetical protein OYC64_012941 [Pagothenia borchgrevinki]|jgi:hypothetical protein
MNLR